MNKQLADRMFNVDLFLQNLTLGISPDQPLIGDLILPPLPGDLPHARIARFDNSAFIAIEDEVGDRGAVKRIDLAKDSVTIDIEGHALEAEVSTREIQAAGKSGAPYDLLGEEAYNVKQTMLLHREVLQAELIQNDSLYGSNVTDLSAGGNIQLDDSSNDPLPGIYTVVRRSLPQASGRKPNLLAMSSDVLLAMTTNPKISSRLYGAGPSPFPVEQQLANILGVDKIVVGSAVTRDDSGAATDIWSEFFGLFYIPPTTGRRIPAFGYTLEQRVFDGATEAVTKRYDEARGPAGTWITKRAAYYTPAILFPSAGWIFTNPLGA